MVSAALSFCRLPAVLGLGSGRTVLPSGQQISPNLPNSRRSLNAGGGNIGIPSSLRFFAPSLRLTSGGEMIPSIAWRLNLECNPPLLSSCRLMFETEIAATQSVNPSRHHLFTVNPQEVS
jgi:hypothetical protein